MKEYNIKFNSHCDDLQLDVIYMEPDEVKGIFVIAHGMCEHKERYLDFMRYLTANGYVTVINDHRGHGKSIKNEEDLGYFYDDSGKYIVEDTHDLVLHFKELYPGVPATLFGHSMGSLVVRAVFKQYDRDIDKLIVCGSPSENSASKLALTLAGTIGKVKGEHHKSNFINSLALGAYQKKFNENIDNTWLSVNRENVKKYNDDPYCGFTFTCNGFKNLFHLMIDVYDLNNWKKENLSCPVYFMAGEFDPCIESKEKWKEAQECFTKLGYKKIQNTLYKNMRHEILQEDDHEQVYNDILNFLNN